VVEFAGSSVNGAGELVGYGNYVVVDHPGGWLTLYAHMSRILARTGETVGAGQLMAVSPRRSDDVVEGRPRNRSSPRI
jgi:murein DD-endopeptidase MepM/ murein hydrolase activator NlpD